MALNRSQLSKFLPDHESIRQFEQALSQIGDTTTVTDQLASDLDAAEATIAAQALLIGQAQSDADAAQTTAGTAIGSAATAQSTANTALTNANTAQSTANTAVSNAATAQGTANTAITNAATAQSTANTAITNAATAQSEIDTHETLIAAHGATGAVVGVTNTQTLTNKTLSAPVLTGVADLQGGALKFPATQVASANPNTLDDYEEGTFTPAFDSDATPATVTYTTQFGRYTKIGNLVYVSIGLQVATKSGGTGNLLVSGLPFAANATGNHGFSNAFVFDFVNQPTAFILSAGGTSIYLYRTTATNTLNPTSDLKATSYCYLSGFYMTA